jgi:hypothetical protein
MTTNIDIMIKEQPGGYSVEVLGLGAAFCTYKEALNFARGYKEGFLNGFKAREKQTFEIDIKGNPPDEYYSIDEIEFK